MLLYLLPRATATQDCQEYQGYSGAFSDTSRRLPLISYGIPPCIWVSLLYTSRDHPNPLKLDYIFEGLFPKKVAFTGTRDLEGSKYILVKNST